VAKKVKFWDDDTHQQTFINIWQPTSFTVTRDGSDDIATYTETWDDVTQTVTETVTPTYHADGYATSINFDDVNTQYTLTISRDSDGRITGGTIS